MIDLLVLGTGAMMPLPDRWLSSMLVRCDGELMLLDCGEGTQIPWRRSRWGFKKLSLICLSHVHADHVAGLPGVLHALANAGREDPLRIVGPVGCAEVVAGLRTIAPDLPYPVEVTELADGSEFPAIAGITGRVIRGQHRLPVLLYRFDLPRTRAFLPEVAERLGVPRDKWRELASGGQVRVNGSIVASNDVHGPRRTGASFGLMTDTRPVREAASFLHGVDLLIAEGTYGNDEDAENAVTNQHMTYREAAEVAKSANVRELLLTHFSPKIADPREWLLNATDVFPATRLAESGLEVTLRFPTEQARS